MARKPLEKRVNLQKPLKDITGPFDFFPQAYIRNKELVICQPQAPDVQVTKREWSILDWGAYFFGDKKPSSTTERCSYKPSIEIRRIPNACGFSIVEKNDGYWIEYE